MKNFIAVIFFSLIFLILQTSVMADAMTSFFLFLNLPSCAQIKINFLLIIIVYIGLNRHMLEGVLIASLLGYFMDLFSPGHFGLHSFLFVIIFLVIRTISTKIYFKAPLMNTFWTINVTLVSNIFLLLIYSTSDNFENFYLSFLQIIFPEALLNGLFAPIIFNFFKVLDLVTDKTMEDEKVITW